MTDQEHSIVIDEDKCTGCGVCVDYCHVDAIAVNPDKSLPRIVHFKHEFAAQVDYSENFDS